MCTRSPWTCRGYPKTNRRCQDKKHMEEQEISQSAFAQFLLVTVEEDMDGVEEIIMEGEEDRNEESWKIHCQQDLVA